jgi:hypothetical protein
VRTEAELTNWLRAAAERIGNLDQKNNEEPFIVFEKKTLSLSAIQKDYRLSFKPSGNDEDSNDFLAKELTRVGAEIISVDKRGTGWSKSDIAYACAIFFKKLRDDWETNHTLPNIDFSERIAKNRLIARSSSSWASKLTNIAHAYSILNGTFPGGKKPRSGDFEKRLPGVLEEIRRDPDSFTRLAIKEQISDEFRDLDPIGLTEEDLGPSLQKNKLSFSDKLTAALAAKPFVILAGGTGTGKTRSARQVAIQIAGKENVNTVAVGADWTDNRPLLGFRNLLSPDGASYVAPEALKLILKADKNLRDASEAATGVGSAESSIKESIKPFFLILDEMNLSHVERYFADFLSSMESGEALKLHDYEGVLKADGSELIIPREVEWPRNLFVIGTVNIDETTYMFSPKVLDRAHVIEFKVSWNEIKTGLSIPPAKALASWSTEQTQNFTNIALDDKKVLEKADQERLENVLAGAYGCLEGSRYNFAHRTARECLNYVAAAQRLSEAKLVEHRETTGLIDLAILQKALPKLNGSAGSLTETLNKLSVLTTTHALKECSDKLREMIKQLQNEQFVSFIK